MSMTLVEKSPERLMCNNDRALERGADMKPEWRACVFSLMPERPVSCN